MTIVDTTPPRIDSVATSPNRLWPPSHAMVPVSVAVTASDLGDPGPVCQIIAVTSNEPLNRPGDGNATPDWEITGKLALKLRAERAGTGNGRVYTITVRCTDASGNASTAAVIVTVPHSQ